MTENDLEDFTALWIAACENSGFKTEPSDAAINLSFDVLQGYTLESVAAAILKFQRMPNRALTPATIESIITGCFWLSASEAWGVAQKTFDQFRAVIITDEIANAANKVKALYTSNQKNAAKDSFVCMYERLMMQSVSLGNKPRWFLMQADERTASASDSNKMAILDAIHQGFISLEKAKSISEIVGCDINFSGAMPRLIAAAPDEKTRSEIEKLKAICQRNLGGKNE